MSRRLSAWLMFSGVAGCAPIVQVPLAPSLALPVTRAEASAYTETSRYADVVAFLEALRAADNDSVLTFGTLGSTTEGRALPFVVASRPRVRTPEDARRLGRPIVYVQGNIHGGEVEGKEALLILLRELAFEAQPNVLDSVVLLAVPLYNADGNEAFGPQERHRPEQNGPPLVGRRANGMGLDLNRDYMKAEAPETRASLALFNAWDPDVFVDLHATNGSFHGYALTYSPPLNPATRAFESPSRWLLQLLRERMRARHGLETFEYGNFGTDDTAWRQRAIYTPAVHAWSTFDSRPRFSTNYYALRGAVAVLSEAYSHDSFERRVAATRAFVRELLSLVAEYPEVVLPRRAIANGMPGLRLTDTVFRDDLQPVPVRARFTTQPYSVPVLVEEIELTADTARGGPGLPAGLRRTGRFRPVEMPLFTRFEGTVFARPALGYVVPAHLERVVELLRAHGVPLERVGNRRFSASEFVIDSIIRSAQAFEGHHPMRVFGSWRPATSDAAPDDYFVSLARRGWLIALYLLEPESDDGVVNWNFLDHALVPGRSYPILSIRGIER